jgi:hypothetical protein
MVVISEPYIEYINILYVYKNIIYNLKNKKILFVIICDCV